MPYVEFDVRAGKAGADAGDQLATNAPHDLHLRVGRLPAARQVLKCNLLTRCDHRMCIHMTYCTPRDSHSSNAPLLCTETPATPDGRRRSVRGGRLCNGRLRSARRRRMCPYCTCPPHFLRILHSVELSSYPTQPEAIDLTKIRVQTATFSISTHCRRPIPRAAQLNSSKHSFAFSFSLTVCYFVK